MKEKNPRIPGGHPIPEHFDTGIKKIKRKEKTESVYYYLEMKSIYLLCTSNQNITSFYTDHKCLLLLLGKTTLPFENMIEKIHRNNTSSI